MFGLRFCFIHTKLSSIWYMLLRSWNSLPDNLFNMACSIEFILPTCIHIPSQCLHVYILSLPLSQPFGQGEPSCFLFVPIDRHQSFPQLLQCNEYYVLLGASGASHQPLCTYPKQSEHLHTYMKTTMPGKIHFGTKNLSLFFCRDFWEGRNGVYRGNMSKLILPYLRD